ncbi:hypothetical protein L917_04534, partial [Phytophthora nicotianae]
MPARYFELREYISADDEELAEEMSSPAANSKLKTLLVQLADAPVKIEICWTRETCSTVCWRSCHHLATISVPPNAEIVHSPDFESGVLKVLGSQVKKLTRAERSSVQPFLR